MIIPMIIQTILLDPTGAVWTDEPSNVSRLDPSGADQIDAEHPSRNRKVVGSNPTSGSKNPQVSAHLRAGWSAVPDQLSPEDCPRRRPEPARWRTR
jgi:hypothetical protein